MKLRFSTLNSVVGRIISFGVLALVVLLLATMLGATGSAKPGEKGSLGQVPAPIETVFVLPTVGTPALPVSSVTVVQPTPSAVRAAEVLERDYGVWGYKVSRYVDAPTTTSGNINYDFDTVAELNAFAAANQVLATSLASRGGQAEVYVTFRTYLTPEQFRAWIRARGANVGQSMLRTVYPDGQEGTLGQGSHQGDTEPLPQDRLDKALQIQLRGEVKYALTLRGLYYTLITVDATRLPEIAADPLVFIANVTPNVVRNELHAVGWQTQEKSLFVNPPTPFWKMEELGLENFAR
jgi:hypothetical protein